MTVKKRLVKSNNSWRYVNGRPIVEVSNCKVELDLSFEGRKKPITERVFNSACAFEIADEILSQPPARSYITRPVKRGEVVFRAVLPSELCLTANKLATRGMQGASWRLAEIKKKLWALLKTQAIPFAANRNKWPLKPEKASTSRPQVIATKFSYRSPDVGSNPAKAAIDMLQRVTNVGQKNRMGLIWSDAPKYVEQIHHWEFCPHEFPAFVLIEVTTGR